MRNLFDPLKRESETLADADAEGHEGAPAAAFRELMHRGQREARAGHPKRMAESDGTAIGIDLPGIVGDAELAQARDHLAGKGLVDLDRIEIPDGEPEPLQELP